MDWMDWLLLRLVTKTNENWLSLENSTLEYALKLSEHLDIQEYVEDNLRKQEQARSNPRKFGG